MFNFLYETFRLGINNLRLHKLRSLLTALGIICGVAAVIIALALGEGGKQKALQQVEQLGATNILLSSIPPPESSDATQRTTRQLTYGLLRGDVERLELLPKVRYIVPIRNTEQEIIYKDRIAQGKGIGATPELFNIMNLRLARGSAFTSAHYESQAAVIVLGAALADQLFPNEDPLFKTVQVGRTGSIIMATVIGVLEPTGLRAGTEGTSIRNLDPDTNAYLPLSTCRDNFGDTITTRRSGSVERKVLQLSEIWLQAENISDVEAVASMAQETIGRFHTQVDYKVDAPIHILRSAEQLSRIFNIVIGTIAGISLVVGGIGIMNIMLATVTERTREIGIRRALGAKRWHITLQFLVETMVVSVAGGLLGIALGVGSAMSVPTIMGWVNEIIFQTTTGVVYPTKINQWSIIFSFAVSAIIGIGFGLYPAVKAAKMSPIEALRHE